MMTCRSVRVGFLFAALLAACPILAENLPPSAEGAKERLAASPRHGEYVKVDAGDGDSVNSWLVYPERSDKAPIVIVIHEIFGLTDWIRSVADQLADDGFIAIAPDLLSGKGPGGGGTESLDQDRAIALVRSLEQNEVTRRLNAVAKYATSLPAATTKFGSVGFCWGGSTSFAYATAQPDLDAAVVYYGSSPETGLLSKVKAPILGLYGADDARVNQTIPAAEAEMKKLGKTFKHETYAGAGHGFLRQQEGRDSANAKAASQAWPRTVIFLRQHLAE